jgi:hypothetical protein
MGKIQQVLRGAPDGHAVFALYQESKIRHVHELLDRWIAKD